MAGLVGDNRISDGSVTGLPDCESENGQDNFVIAVPADQSHGNRRFQATG